MCAVAIGINAVEATVEIVKNIARIIVAVLYFDILYFSPFLHKNVMLKRVFNALQKWQSYGKVTECNSLFFKQIGYNISFESISTPFFGAIQVKTLLCTVVASATYQGFS